MAQHLLIVEGSHDAAFFSHLLAARGFAEARKLPQVPEFWRQMIPRQFPARADQHLDRVMNFPEIYSNAERGDSAAIEIAEGDGAVLNTLRTYLDNYEVNDFASLSLFLDTDWEMSEDERFARFRERLDPWNAEGVRDERPGFPLSFPRVQNTVANGAPRVGIYLLPGGGRQGTLETILLACAELRYPDLHRQALQLIQATEVSYPADADPDPLAQLRRGSGRHKAHCGIIGNVFKPGASLSVSLRKTRWLPEAETSVPSLAEAAAFLDQILAPP